jgi:hypothetical protein
VLNLEEIAASGAMGGVKPTLGAILAQSNPD